MEDYTGMHLKETEQEEVDSIRLTSTGTSGEPLSKQL
jgi:hypothetical protein